MLTRDNVNVNAQDSSFGWTPLHMVAVYGVLAAAETRGNLEVAKYLLSRDDINVNAQDNRRFTPLHRAAWHRNWDMVKYLLSRDDVDVNARIEYAAYITPLDVLARSWYSHMDMALLSRARARGGVCVSSTQDVCGLVMRPRYFILTINTNHSGAVHTVTATDSFRPDAATIYSLVHSNGLSLTVNSETGVLSLPADAGVLTEGIVATASIQATTEGGTQSVTVEVVIKVSAADDGNAGFFHPPDVFQNPPLQLIPPAQNQFKPPKLARARPPTIPKSPAILGAPPLPPPSRFRVSFFHA